MFCVKGSLRRSRVRENAKTLTSSLMRVEIITHAPSASQARHLPPGGRLIPESVYTVASNNSVARGERRHTVCCRYMPEKKNHSRSEVNYSVFTSPSEWFFINLIGKSIDLDLPYPNSLVNENKAGNEL